ncbi:MAG: hypothetical protein UR31_C0023G0005 [Parcubacteria group bacterium GW2011_GWA2_33_14]|uniref:Uncharacterized protein n=1 Tax=Candidatus Staskawiczbacteria bacterium RIFCSPHIGHO2_02_FULL_33_16 TaxID=1802204 RepID=A0A1G2HYL8_9BACT|nr:MAG: hypothetical protein UR31_C0023G0005 [Parcubacteria group bacterium GW2011_GWA2_33_14]OGZ67583.1 MAG: hypothetical protein A3D34_00285 [Candidatus Staskawiczbacteria bacterium RIFCSPHIGHO2_02_FULL_33_16]
MNKEKGFIQNIIIIIILLIVIFLSQQPHFRPAGEKAYSQMKKQGELYGVKFNSWFNAHVYPKVSGQVASGGEVIKKEIENQKNNIAKNSWEKIKNYLAENFSKFFGTKVE